MAWTHRAENIRQRDWTDIIEHWAGLSSDFDTAHYANYSLEQAAESAVTATALNGNNVVVVEFDDHLPFLAELVFSQVKANHALICAVQRIVGGQSSWGVTDAYHASMLLMRSILSALGVFVCRAHDRNILVDVFPWLGRVDDRRRFRRTHKNWQRCAALISSSAKDFSQSDLYSLFQRVLNISTVPPDVWPEVVVRNIIQTNKSHFSASRNQLIYGSRFWFNSDDLFGECLSVGWVNQIQRNMVAYAFTKEESASEVDCYCDCWVLYQLSLRLHERIYAALTDSLGVFSYIEARRLDLALVERQFADTI